jgi:hypothetical protein
MRISGPALFFTSLSSETSFMRPVSRFKPGVTVRQILAERLEETKRSSDELADAIEVPSQYIHDLIGGRRRPPMPARTDVYERMTRFLKLGRTDLADCATAERAEMGEDRAAPTTAVRDQMLGLCTGSTASRLRQGGRKDQAMLVDLFARVLAVAQLNVCRSLVEGIPLRIMASRNGVSYAEVRLRVLEFLDTTPATLTVADLVEFVLPHIAEWDVDENGVLKVVLRSAVSTERHQRRPLVRVGRTRMAG